jgi:ElaB/YqjD/DUF883 family membrane-anchored ribosome-binding protein
MAAGPDNTENVQEQIARLREQVETLMKDRITPAVADFAERAHGGLTSATGVVRDQARAVSGRVQDRPLIAIMVAVAVGWVIGRVTR